MPVTLPLHQRGFPTLAQGKLLDPEQTPEILEAGRDILTGSPMSIRVLGEQLAGRFPVPLSGAMALVCRFLLPLVQTTPRGVWGASYQATPALAGNGLRRRCRLQAHQAPS